MAQLKRAMTICYHGQQSLENQMNKKFVSVRLDWCCV
jgi:hypothetical protein